jgi:hypothetical protein
LDTTLGLSLALEDLVRASVHASGTTDESRSFLVFVLPWGSVPLRRSQIEKSTSRRHVRVKANAKTFL